MHHSSRRRNASVLRIPRLGAPVQSLPDWPQDWLHFCSFPKILGELAAILRRGMILIPLVSFIFYSLLFCLTKFL